MSSDLLHLLFMEKTMPQASSVTHETVLKVSKLARIKISQEDIDHLSKEMSGILNWIDLLNSVDTSSVPPLSSPLQNISSLSSLREDIVTDGDIVEKILSNAPEVALDMFVVPKVVE